MMTLDGRERRAARMKSTGGSTGEPLRYYISTSALAEQWAQIWRGWSVAGFRPGSPIGIVAGRSLLAGEGLRRRIYGRLQNWVSLDAFDLSEEAMAEFVRSMRRRGARYLYGYASALESLASWLTASGERLAVEAVFTTAEQLLPQTRRVIESGTGGVVFDGYGANDGGVFGFECELHEGLHLGSERCLVEIVREDGSPAPEGGIGRVVSSDLENLAFPFLRYDVGDLAALVAEPCRCGRGLPRLQNLSGRSTDVVRLPGNRLVHGEVFSHYFKKAAAVGRFQAIQEAMGSVEVRIRPLQAITRDDLEGMRRDLSGLLPGLRVRMRITEQFEKSPAGKVALVIPLRGTSVPAGDPAPLAVRAAGGYER
jgi:phenylacetate-CoA ligase